jgi:hypothetical protein
MRHQESGWTLRRWGALALLLATGGLLPGCSTDDEDTGDETELVFTTSIEAGHQHTVSVPRSLLQEPPQGGEIELLTTVDSGHQHEVELTVAELDTLEEGGAVSKTTTINDGHSHTLTMNPGAGTPTP